MGKGSDDSGFMGFRQRHLFNLYLVLGSISIVVATTLFTNKIFSIGVHIKDLARTSVDQLIPIKDKFNRFIVK